MPESFAAMHSYAKLFVFSLQLAVLVCIATRFVECATSSIEAERSEMTNLPATRSKALYHPYMIEGRNYIDDEGDDLIDMEQKRAQWNNLQGGWGKRADNWNKLSAAWGKREQAGNANGRWNNLSAMWGKRESPNWNKLRGMWGK